jgi:hypothetical protein
MASKPANPPRISFAAGELTVTADNSSMGDVLRGISRATGAHLEGSQSDPERVFGQFGPDTPRAVLSSLLSGSRYDFILVGAIDDPGVVQRILLSPRGVAPSTSATAANQGAPRQGFSTPQPEEEDSNESFVAPQPQVVEQPAQAQAPQPADQSQSQQQFGQPQQTVKTPEQLLQELQRLRQQQQQQQQTPR